ncbi:MAG: hypothetical protein AB2L18_06705 [Anaerolineaceae bacterium]
MKKNTFIMFYIPPSINVILSASEESVSPGTFPFVGRKELISDIDLTCLYL